MRANGEIKDAFYFENNTPEDTFRDKETGQQQERSSLPVSQQRGIVPSNVSSMQRDAKVVADLAAAVAQAAATGETEAQQLAVEGKRVLAIYAAKGYDVNLNGAGINAKTRKALIHHLSGGMVKGLSKLDCAGLKGKLRPLLVAAAALLDAVAVAGGAVVAGEEALVPGEDGGDGAAAGGADAAMGEMGEMGVVGGDGTAVDGDDAAMGEVVGVVDEPLAMGNGVAATATAMEVEAVA